MGNTAGKCRPERPAPVHPHGRGEHPSLRKNDRDPIGSSPRAWGTLSTARHEFRNIRFIPTGVGNTIPAGFSIPDRAVHPHGRGEHYPFVTPVSEIIGSSPRAWGTRSHRHQDVSANRFIPTGVGNTSQLLPVDLRGSVHPHGRGEHFHQSRSMFPEDGSSPRAWGTPIARPFQMMQSRFIPTGVGNTGWLSRACRGCPVHPHGRGEHRYCGGLKMPRCGSSPRAWGTPPAPSLSTVIIRFIPTGVGNTSTGDISTKQESVHPHGRGEHEPLSSEPEPEPGSSPRAWGTLSGLNIRPPVGRFIPTGVGNTNHPAAVERA